jgi:hypothetical protein
MKLRRYSYSIAVLLKNKIGGLDSVLPILMEVARINPRAKIEFHTLHAETYEAIKTNTVLWNAVHEVGVLPNYNQKGALRNKLTKILMLFRLMIMGVLGRTHFIHFKELSMWPMRILYFAAPKRTYYIRDGAFGTPEMLQRLIRVRQGGGPYLYRPNSGHSGLQVFFHTESLGYDGVAHDAPLAIVRPPRTLQVWKDFIIASAKSSLEAELKANNLDPDSDIIGYMVTEPYVSDTQKNCLRVPESLPQLFEKTLDILVEEANGLPIFIRSQMAFDFPYIDEQIRKRPGAKIVRSNLHASVMATRAKFFITNWMTTTLADARTFSVPTIEFCDFNDRMKEALENGSACPDWTTHFINLDAEQLRTTVRELLNTDYPKTSLPMSFDDNFDITQTLAANKPWHPDALSRQNNS